MLCKHCEANVFHENLEITFLDDLRLSEIDVGGIRETIGRVNI
jgi:hypothetical protein